MNSEEVRTLRIAHRYREAIDLALKLLSQGQDRRVRTQLDWSWYGLIKELVQAMVLKLKASKPIPPGDIANLITALQSYSHQPAIRPDTALSNILREVSKVAGHLPDFPDFLRWVDIDGLALEDWQYQQRDGNTYRPVAIGVARGLAKWVKAHRDADQADIALAHEWLERIRPAARGDDALWLDWDRALMLRRMGEHRQAAETLSGVLKAKRGEFWVWAEAARLYADEQPDLAQACYCRALQCGAEGKFTVNVHRELAVLLADQEEYAQASSEVAQAIEIRQQEGWSVDPPLQQLIDSAWYDPTAEGIEDPRVFYARHSSDALVLCFDHVEAKPATFLGVLIPQPPKDPPRGWKPRPLPRFAMLDDQGKAVSLVGPGLRNLKYEVGAPVTVVIGHQNDDRRESIVQVAPRPDGDLWECVNEVAALVVRSAGEDGSLKVFIDRDNGEQKAHASALARVKDVRAGDGLRLRVATNPKRGTLDVVLAERAPPPSSSDIRTFSGRLRRHEKGFAFLDDVHIPKGLLESIPQDVSAADVLAVYSRHPTKDEYSWRAVTLTPHAEAHP